MERRVLLTNKTTARLEKRADGSETIIGYAAVHYDGTPDTEYNLWDGLVERIAPGAFAAAMDRKDDTRALFNHDSNLILGRTLSNTLRLSVDETGLRYEIDPADTTISRDVREHLRRGDVTGSSFQFIVDVEEWDMNADPQVRTIKSVTLYDVGPVTFPAYTATTSGIRASGDVTEARKAHEAQSKLRLEHQKYMVRAALARIGAPSGI